MTKEWLHQKYIAQDILTLAGIEAPILKIWKMSVHIGGLAVNIPNKIINVTTEKIDVIVGTEKVEVTIPAEQDPAHATNVASGVK